MDFQHWTLDYTYIQIGDVFLFQKLGLEEASALGLDTSTLFSNEDLMVRNMYLPLYDLFLVMNMCIWFNLLKINFYSLVDQ